MNIGLLPNWNDATAVIKGRLVGACSNQSFLGNCTYFIAGVADLEQKW